MSNPIANKGRATESATVVMLTGERGIVVMKGRSQGPSTFVVGQWLEHQKRAATVRRLNLSLNLPPVAAQKPSIQS